MGLTPHAALPGAQKKKPLISQGLSVFFVLL